MPNGYRIIAAEVGAYLVRQEVVYLPLSLELRAEVLGGDPDLLGGR